MTDPDLRVSARVGMAVGAEHDPASAGAAHVLRAGLDTILDGIRVAIDRGRPSVRG